MGRMVHHRIDVGARINSYQMVILNYGICNYLVDFRWNVDITKRLKS